MRIPLARREIRCHTEGSGSGFWNIFRPAPVQNIISDKPYQFVPPHRGRFLRGLIEPWLPRYLRKYHGLARVECRGTEHLKQSLEAGHGILLAPNHCRPCDPMALGMLSRAVCRPFFVMAARHLFEQSRLQTWMLRRAGAFSVYREGMDREALKAAVEILKEAERPLVIFPEGTITRTNDRLAELMDGTAFIARNAAKQRAAAATPGRVVAHPVAIRYHFEGDIEAALTPTVEEIEARLSWQPRRGNPLIDRIYKIGGALLTLKEIEYFGQTQPGGIDERLGRLINRLLSPLEKEWLKGESGGGVVARVKKLRTAILAEMVNGEIAEEERARRWRQLVDLYLAQQLSCYPPDYVGANPSPERLLETVERFEEDLTDVTRVYTPLRAVITVGTVIPVNPARARGTEDPVMEEIRRQLAAMLGLPAEKSSAPPASGADATPVETTQ